MWKQYWVLGIIISLGVGLAAVAIKLTGDDLRSDSLFLAVRTVRYTFTGGLLAFFLHLWLNQKMALFIKKWRYLAYLSNILIVTIAIGLASIALDLVFGGFLKNLSLTISAEDLNWYLVIFRCLLMSLVQFFIIFYLQLLREKQNRDLEIEKLKQAQLEADLSNLKEQMNPHFLFNTLNTLSAITQDEQVKEYVSELACVYRYMLVHNKLNLVPLESELIFIKSYLYIIKARMGDAIDIAIELEDKLMAIMLPPLTLQLLLENAIKHNVASTARPLQIQLYNDLSHIYVRNSFMPKKSQFESTSVGLNNLKDRYKLLFSTDILIEKSATTFIVKLPYSYENTHYRK